MAVLPAVTAVLYVTVLPAVTAVLLHHSSACSCCSTVTSQLCLQFLQYCYITLLWIHGLTAMLLVQGRGEMAVLPAVTAVQLHHNAMDLWTDCNCVSTG